MNICFCGIVFNGDHFLEPCIRAVQPYGKVVFVEGPTAHYQQLGYTTSTDETNQILADLLGEGNVLHGQFAEKDDEAATTACLIPDNTEWVWWLDSDEVWKSEDIESVLALLEHEHYDSIAFKANSFFGGFDYILGGFEEEFEVHRVQRWYAGAHWHTHRPPRVLAPDGKPWSAHKHLSHTKTDALGIRLFHYSYVFPSQVAAKAGYYQTYNAAICIPDYFRTVFLPWVCGNLLARTEIEARWRGVHNFLPEYRGDCYPRLFTGEHPAEIEKRLARLQARLSREIRLSTFGEYCRHMNLPQGAING